MDRYKQSFNNLINFTVEAAQINSNYVTSNYAYKINEMYNNSSTELYYNFTLPDLENATSTEKVTLKLYDYMIPLIGAVVIALNLAVVISSGLILKKGQQPRSTYLFLGNVAMSDLVTGVAVVFGQAYPNKYRNAEICAIQIGMIVSSTIASVYSVGLIAVDRFLYILHGLQYQRWVYPFRARLCIFASWIVGLIIGFLPLMGWAGDTKDGKVCWFILLAPKDLIMLTVAFSSVPLVTVIILYSIILYHAINKIVILQKAAEAEAENKVDPTDSGLRIFRGRGNVSDSENEEPPGQREEKSLFKKIFTKRPSNNVKSPSKWKAIKVVMFTTGSFLITWGPYFVACLIYSYCEDFESPRCTTLSFLIASPLAILGFFNSLINPIIYAWWHQGFKTFVTSKFNSFRKKRARTSNTTSKNTTSTDTRTSSKSNSVESILHLDKVSNDGIRNKKSESRKSSKENLSQCAVTLEPNVKQNE